VSDVLVADAAIEIRNTKFFKSRRLPLAKSTFSVLQDYLKERRRAGGPDDPDSPLLWHQKGAGRYSMTRAEKILFAVLRQAGLKPAHGRKGPRIHDFRHYPERQTMPSCRRVSENRGFFCAPRPRW